MQSLYQSIIPILSSFWTYRLLEFNENIEKLTCRESVRCQIPPKPYCSLQRRQNEISGAQVSMIVLDCPKHE